MKTTFTLEKATGEKGGKNLKQALDIILFTMLLSIIPASNGGSLLAGISRFDGIGDKSESSKSEYDFAPATPFQALQQVDEVHPVIEWDKTIGGNDIDELSSATPTSEGGYLLVGFSNSPASGDKSEDSKGDTDYWIVKIDANGNKVWDKTLGGSSSDEPQNVISIPEGGYLLVGFSNSPASGDKNEDSKGDTDYWVVKIDANGNKVWDKTLGGSSSDGVNSVASTPDGGYLLGGTSLSNASGDKSENNKGGYDYWIVKIDTNGNKVWDKTLGGGSGDYLHSTIPTPDGGYLLTGYSESDASGDKSEHSKGGYDYWIVKIDANGNKVWDKTLGGSSREWLTSTLSTPDGGYLLEGYSESDASGDKSENNKGGYDYWIVKIDANGNKVWDKTLGGSGYDYLNTAIPTPDGGYLLSGISNSPASGDKSEHSKGYDDYWIVKIDAEGNKQWDKTLGGKDYDFLLSAIPTADGGYLLAGTSYSDVSGDKSEDSKGEGDYWVIKLKDFTTPAAMSFTLVDAKTDQEIRALKNEDKIYLAEVGMEWLNIRANISGQIDRVNLELQGPITHTQTELEFPYLLFGDKDGELFGRKLLPGEYTLTATPFSKDKKGIALTVSFQVRHSVARPTIEWDKTIGGSGHDFLHSAIPTSDGGYLLAGTSQSGVSKDKSEPYKDEVGGLWGDYWVVKIDANHNKVWDKTFGGRYSDQLSSVISTLDGGYLLAGTSRSDASGDKSENNKGNIKYVNAFDYWVIKIDANGNKIWDKTFGGRSVDELQGVTPTLDGGYLLAGSSGSNASGDKSENSKGFSDYWVVKIDADGNKIWDKTFGGSISDHLYSVIPTIDGNYLLAGSSRSNASGDKSENTKGSCDEYGNCEVDYWVIKIDAQGNKIWDKTFGGESMDELRGATPTLDGGYLLAGTSSSDASGDKSENRKGGLDYWVVKIDAQGNKVWDKTIGGNSPDYLSSVISTPDGGYLLAGYSGSIASGDKGEISKGLSDYWVVKIDAQGKYVWDKTLGGSRTDELHGIISTPDGDYLLAGFSISDASIDKSQDSKGRHDYWIIKLKDSTTPLVTSFTFMDAKTNQEIRELKDEDIIYVAELGSGLANVRANTSGQIDHVKLQLQGSVTHMLTEREFPYALFGDYPTGDFKGKEWLPGKYTLTATPFSKGKKGNTLTVTFEVTDAFAITGFILIDAKRNQVVGEVSEGNVIDLASFNNHPLTIRANTEPLQIGKVIFALEGPVTHTQIEKEFPYALFGDDPTGNFKGKKLFPGNYTLTATPYALDSMGSSSTIHFTVIDSRVPVPEASSLRVEVYPVPTSDIINILHEGRSKEAQLMLLDFGGNILLQQPLQQQLMEQLDMSGFRKGIYYLKVVSAETVQVFRVVKE